MNYKNADIKKNVWVGISLITKGSFRRATLSFILRSKGLGSKAPKIDISITPPPNN